jgi:hypothetical protein
MTLVNTDQTTPALLNPLGATPLPEDPKTGPSPGFGAALGAAFRTENLIGSYIMDEKAQQGTDNLPQLGYNVWDDIKGTKYEDYWSSFLESNNANRTAALKRQIDREEDDKRTLAAAGWRGTIANLAAGFTDPTVLIPVGGEFGLAGKGAWRLGRGALAGARGAGVGTTLQEIGLHETQQTRTVEESAMAIGSSVVLGGILGGGAAALMSRPEKLAAQEALERLHEAPRAADQAEPVSAGAAAAQRPTIDDLTVSGRVAEKVASTTRMISPNLRANFRAAPSARQFSQELAENTLYQGMHDEGRTLGASVETEARTVYRSRLAQAIQAQNDIFGEMKKSGVNMSRQDFEESIGRAMRRGDVGDNDFVSRAAKTWRETVFDPWKNEAIEHNLLPADVDVKTADSYFSRLWNRQRLTAQEDRFKEITRNYYEGQIAGDYAQSVDGFQRLMKRFDEQEADFKLPPAKRTKTIADIEAKGEALDTANAFHVDRLAEVNDLRQKARLATNEGRFTDADVLKLEARKHYEEGGESLKAYVVERRALRQRRDRLANTPAAKAARDVRLRKIAEKRAAAERLFYDRWEIKRLGEGVNPHDPSVRPDFKAHAKDIADEVFDKLTGRDAGNSSSVAPEYLVPLTRGPMKDRTFNIPDQLIEDFLEDNVISVGERYGRSMSSDIELTRRFGRADMRDQIQTIRDEYRQLREAAKSEGDRKALTDDEKGAVNDLEAMRDLIRGTYKSIENSSNYGRLVRSLMAFNYLRQMGGVIIANMAELYRPAMVHGLGRYMNEGVRPLLTNLKGIKLSVAEAKLAGQVTERVLQNRMMGLGEIGDPYRSGTAVERWLTNGTRFASKWNGLVYWTDGMKAISSVLSQNRIIEAAAKGDQKRTLAYLGIDEDMAKRIAAQFSEHGDTHDNVRVANTQQWTDDEAVRAYRNAVGKDVDSIIVTKSVGDVPLLANTPTGKLILQFRNYTFSAHQRVTLRALQEGKAQFLSGMVGITALGMMGAVLRSWRAGERRLERFAEAANNPGYLIGEGLDLGGMFALPIEIANDVEKLTGPAGFSFNPIKTPLKASGRLVNPEASLSGQSVRFSSRDPIGAILGPTAGLPATVAQAAGAGGALSVGGQPTQGQASAATSLVPFGSYIGMKEAIQAVTGDSPYASPP